MMTWPGPTWRGAWPGIGLDGCAPGPGRTAMFKLGSRLECRPEPRLSGSLAAINES